MCAVCPQIKSSLRFVPKLPEHGPKDQRNPNRERKPCSVVCWRPPKGDEEFLEADQVLPLGTAGVLGVKMQRRNFGIWFADFFYDHLLPPVSSV